MVGDDPGMQCLGVWRNHDLAVLGGDRRGIAHRRLAPEVKHLARVQLALAAVHRQADGLGPRDERPERPAGGDLRQLMVVADEHDLRARRAGIVISRRISGQPTA